MKLSIFKMIALSLPVVSVKPYRMKTSFKFDVYIEYTDTFQMLFNSNYPMLVERSVNDRNEYENSGCRLMSTKSMKFKKKASLGDSLEFVVKSKKDSNSHNDDQLVSDIVKFPQMFDISCSIQTIADDTIFQCTKATFLHSDMLLDEIISHNTSPSFIPNLKIHESENTLYSDELVVIKKHDKWKHMLSTKTIFNLFERSRTDILGGPKELASTADTSLHIYVARISDYIMYNHDCFHSVVDDNHKSPSTSYLPNNKLKCKVYSQIESMGRSIINFHQQIILLIDGTNGGSGTVVAKATVTCVCVDSSTGNPAELSQEIYHKLFSDNTVMAQ